MRPHKAISIRLIVANLQEDAVAAICGPSTVNIRADVSIRCIHMNRRRMSGVTVISGAVSGNGAVEERLLTMNEFSVVVLAVG